MPKNVLIFLFGLVIAMNSHADEFLFAGQVQQLTFKPSGLNDCPPPCGWPKPPKEGIESVCISNMGGCQIAEIKVIKDYLGNANAALQTIHARTGEWGDFVLPVRVETILIHAKDGSTRWAPIVERDGKLLVEPGKLSMGRASYETKYKLNPNALVPVEDALEQIRAKP
jgi:hypothetical protein